jgi:hypothetical protein
VCVTSAWNEFDVCFLVSFRTTLSSSFVLTCIILHMCLPMCEVMTDHVTIVDRCTSWFSRFHPSYSHRRASEGGALRLHTVKDKNQGLESR